MEAMEQDMVMRRPWLLTYSLPITFTNTLGAALLSVTLSLGIIFLFSLPLLWSATQGEHTEKKTQSHPIAKGCQYH